MKHTLKSLSLKALLVVLLAGGLVTLSSCGTRGGGPNHSGSQSCH